MCVYIVDFLSLTIFVAISFPFVVCFLFFKAFIVDNVIVFFLSKKSLFSDIIFVSLVAV
jgi:hypothetical protein